MVNWNILKDKIQKISTLIKITKWVGAIIIIMNALGWAYNKLDFTISMSFIAIILFWLWALDTQVGNIEKVLKEKEILKK